MRVLAVQHGEVADQPAALARGAHQKRPGAPCLEVQVPIDVETTYRRSARHLGPMVRGMPLDLVDADRQRLDRVNRADGRHPGQHHSLTKACCRFMMRLSPSFLIISSCGTSLASSMIIALQLWCLAQARKRS